MSFPSRGYWACFFRLVDVVWSIHTENETEMRRVEQFPAVLSSAWATLKTMKMFFRSRPLCLHFLVNTSQSERSSYKSLGWTPDWNCL